MRLMKQVHNHTIKDNKRATTTINNKKKRSCTAVSCAFNCASISPYAAIVCAYGHFASCSYVMRNTFIPINGFILFIRFFDSFFLSSCVESLDER